MLIYETIERKIGDGKRAVFTLQSGADCYHCDIKIITCEGETESIYRRDFPGDTYHGCHYRNFRNKFCRDLVYREKWRTIKKKVKHPFAHFSKDKSLQLRL